MLYNLQCKKKGNDRKIFHSRAKLIADDSDIDQAFKTIHQSIMTKIKNSPRENWIVIETVIKHSSKNFKCAQKNGDNKQFAAILHAPNICYQGI